VKALQEARFEDALRESASVVLTDADRRMEGIEAHLARAAKDPDFSLDLCLACWRVDLNRNGEIDERDLRMLQVEYDAQGEQIPEGDPRRMPTFRFDAADVS
jgi:hypothetical protein